MAVAIGVEGLVKEYRARGGTRTRAVDGLDLEVRAGGVFGFLGPNGSGKTTTIRCMLGLARPTRGTIEIAGGRLPRDIASVARKVGSVVEGAPAFPTMTAREQLRLLASMDGIPARRVDDVLERVGLATRATDAVKRYSLGMRQRLALAAALLKDPEVLVLDEPASGLDPAGIRDLRVVMRELADRGGTVFLSSHLLTEVEQLCDAVAIVHHGRVVRAGSVRAVLDDGAPAAILVSIADRPRARSVLAAAGFHVDSESTAGRLRVTGTTGDRIAAALGAAGLWPTALEPEEHHLESLFLEVTAP